MSVLSCARIAAFLLALVSLAMLVPAAFALALGETALFPLFALPALCALPLAAAAFAAGRRARFAVSIRGAYAAAALCWVSASALGALPLRLSGCYPRFADAFFEAVSGFSTTGATVLADVSALPVSLNVWRCEMHWLGGMGILALAVALLPLLGIGGFQLIKTETPGPEKVKMTPKIAVTAKILWLFYVCLTAAQTAALCAAGMSFPDALAHAFSTAASGGFSTRTESIGYYRSTAVNMICAVFMILATVNFTEFFYLVTRRFREAAEHTETKAYLAVIALATAALTAAIAPDAPSLPRAAEAAFFHTVSVISTTGFAASDFAAWRPAAQMVLFALLLVGGSSGSTAGGVKVIRWVALLKLAGSRFRELLHPHGVFALRMNQRRGRQGVVYSVAAFLFIYAALTAATAFAAALDGADMMTAVSGALSLVGNAGPGLGRVGPMGNFGFFSAPAKLWFCFAMLAGRLELYTMLFVCLPVFWKRDA